MKTKDLSELRNKTRAELTKMTADLRSEINRTNMTQAAHKNKNTNITANLKQKLAIVLSISKEKELYAQS